MLSRPLHLISSGRARSSPCTHISETGAQHPGLVSSSPVHKWSLRPGNPSRSTPKSRPASCHPHGKLTHPSSTSCLSFPLPLVTEDASLSVAALVPPKGFGAYTFSLLPLPASHWGSFNNPLPKPSWESTNSPLPCSCSLIQQIFTEHLGLQGPGLGREPREPTGVPDLKELTALGGRRQVLNTQRHHGSVQYHSLMVSTIVS